MTNPGIDPQSPVDAEDKSDADNGEPKTDELRDARPAWWSLLVLMGMATALLAVFGLSVKSLPVALVEMLLGATALSIGAFLGFLFGMPRPAADGSGDSTYRPSTNLEQVSDWLTKLLIGAGLVQLAGLRDSLAGVGTLVSKIATPVPAGVGIVSQLTLLIFLVIGFLSSFLWTRLYYGRIQTLTDRSLFGEVQALKRETKESIQALAKGGLGGSAGSAASPDAAGNLSLAADSRPAIQLPPEIQEKLKQFLRAPRIWDSDPNAELFAGAPQQADGRRFDAEIVSKLSDGLLIKLKVVRVSGDPLDAETLFLLHPTIPERAHRATPRNGVAETSVYAEGAFTAVAITDGGRTILSYDLKNLKGAPKGFREN